MNPNTQAIQGSPFLLLWNLRRWFASEPWWVEHQQLRLPLKKKKSRHFSSMLVWSIQVLLTQCQGEKIIGACYLGREPFKTVSNPPSKMEALLSFAKLHLNKGQDFWKNVLWTDETVKCSPSCCHKPNTEFQQKHLIPSTTAVEGGWSGLVLQPQDLGTLQSLS